VTSCPQIQRTTFHASDLLASHSTIQSVVTDW